MKEADRNRSGREPWTWGLSQCSCQRKWDCPLCRDSRRLLCPVTQKSVQALDLANRQSHGLRRDAQIAGGFVSGGLARGVWIGVAPGGAGARSARQVQAQIFVHHRSVGRRSLGDRSILTKMVDRSDVPELQAVVGLGGPGQPKREGRAAHRADGAGVAQPDRGLIPSNGPSLCPVSRSTLVSAKGRAFLRRHANHVEAVKLARRSSLTADSNQTREKCFCPDHRVSQSCGLTIDLARVMKTSATEDARQTAAHAAADGSNYALRMCDTRT
jgi:hypothetical protein